MRNKILTVSCLVLCCMLVSSAARAGIATAAKPPALASYDWSVNSAHSLASNPPPTDVVQAFVNAASRNDIGHVCEFRFADLRRSRNLSLIVANDAGGTGGCSETAIFDKTASGFEVFLPQGAFSSDDGVQDINHDGRSEIVLWFPLGIASADLGEKCTWPMVFAWTGSAYAYEGDRYKAYYEHYLKSLEDLIATQSTGAQEARGAEVGHTATPEPSMTPGLEFRFGDASFKASNSVSMAQSAIAAKSPSSAPTPELDESDYACLRVDAAKTEAFLGRPLDASMRYSIKASESKDPEQRKLAAIILSFIGTSEATADLKELANDVDPAVATVGKDGLSAVAQPDPDYQKVAKEKVEWLAPIR